MSKSIVVSGIALEGGGTLSILQDCLRELSHPDYNDLRVHVLLKDRKLAGGEYPQFNFIELDGARSYFHKFYYEYFFFRKLSAKLNADLWISMHDVTPNVIARHQAVYCHNPASFYRISPREFLLDPKFGLFTIFYGIFYRINLHRNSWVIVQQSWIRKEFTRRFGVPENKIVVAHPHVFFTPEKAETRQNAKTVFFYPTYPRVFKNIEAICEALKLIPTAYAESVEVILTVTGDENGYSRWLKLRYGHLPMIKWIGHQPRNQVYKIYAETDALIFPSKLETWGLPITEFKQTGKPILVARLPYATETVNDYNKVIFFDPMNPGDVAEKMMSLISGSPVFTPSEACLVEEPKAHDWKSLFKIIIPG